MSDAALEARRRAVVSALKADALAARVAVMSSRLTEVQARLAAVENMLLEASWESPAVERPAPEGEPSVEPPIEASIEPSSELAGEPAADLDDRVAVPKLDLAKGGFSRAASQALFGH